MLHQGWQEKLHYCISFSLLAYALRMLEGQFVVRHHKTTGRLRDLRSDSLLPKDAAVVRRAQKYLWP